MCTNNKVLVSEQKPYLESKFLIKTLRFKNFWLCAVKILLKHNLSIEIAKNLQIC